MTRSSIVRFAGRLMVAGVVLAFVGIVAVQYAKIIERNVALAHTLRDVEHDVDRLAIERRTKWLEIRRLSEPRGAIPEIHDRLHLVGEHEAIIYLKGSPTH